MRKQTPYEKPFRGLGRPEQPISELAVVDGIDTKRRTVNISWMNKGGGKQDVPIWADRNDYSLPRAGDMVMCIVDRFDRAHVVGFRDVNIDERIQDNNLVEAEPGEMLRYSKEFKQRLHFKSDGSIVLATERDEGIEIIPTEKMLMKSDLVESRAFGGRMRLGTVRRRVLGGLPTLPAPDQPIQGPLLFPEQEFQVEVSFFPGALRPAARFAMGTAIVKDNPPPGAGNERSMFGGDLRAVLEVADIIGIPLANFSVDEEGAISLFSIKEIKLLSLLVEILAPEVTVRSAAISLGIAPFDNPILGNIFVTLFNTHTHTCPQSPAGVQVTGPPNVQAPAQAVLSKSVSIGIV